MPSNVEHSHPQATCPRWNVFQNRWVAVQASLTANFDVIYMWKVHESHAQRAYTRHFSRVKYIKDDGQWRVLQPMVLSKSCCKFPNQRFRLPSILRVSTKRILFKKISGLPAPPLPTVSSISATTIVAGQSPQDGQFRMVVRLPSVNGGGLEVTSPATGIQDGCSRIPFRELEPSTFYDLVLVYTINGVQTVEAVKRFQTGMKQCLILIMTLCSAFHNNVSVPCRRFHQTLPNFNL